MKIKNHNALWQFWLNAAQGHIQACVGRLLDWDTGKTRSGFWVKRAVWMFVVHLIKLVNMLARKHDNMPLGCRNVLTVCTNVQKRWKKMSPSPLSPFRPSPCLLWVILYTETKKKPTALLEPVKDGTFINPHWDQV